MKTDWKRISAEITQALRDVPEPKPRRKVIPLVVVRESAHRAEQAKIILGRIA
jgi:hypothetical protein